MEEVYKGSIPNDKTGTPARIAADIINQNFAYLEAKILNKDQVIVLGTYVLVGQNLTLYAGWVWQINGVSYTNPSDVVINFPYAASGMQRLDRVVFNTSNTFNRIAYPESVSNPIETPAPPNTISFGLSLITDSSIGEPTDPIIGDSYVEKIESQDFVFNSVTAVINQIDLIDNRSSVLITGSITDVKSLQVPVDCIRPGKPFFFKNKTGHNVTLWYNGGTGNLKFYFPDAVNLVVKQNEIIEFNLSTTGNKLEIVGRNIKNTDDLAEGSTNKFSTLALVLAYVLTGVSFATGTAITAADTFLSAFGKLQKQITDNIAAIALKQVKDDQVEISANGNVLNAWHGQTVLFTANCTITVPATLNNSLMFPFRTLPGVTVTWAITSPFTWETTPIATAEKTVGHFMRRGSTNTIILDV